MNNKEKYRQFCREEENIPIFSKDWWLDVVCGKDNWDVAIVEKNGQIIASLPYYFKKKFMFNIITMPLLTQIMGPMLHYQNFKSHYDKIEQEKNFYTKLIENLPKYIYFKQNFHYSVQNWLPFFWKGFQQTTKYTYIIEDLTDLKKVFKSFSYAKRKNIKKAEKIVTIKYDLPARDFYENHKMTLKKQNELISYNFTLFEKIYNACREQNSGKTIYAIDNNGNIHSALFVVWSKMSAYNLISTIDPDFRNSGSASLLIREIIKYVSDKTERFDFEGSMIEGVERSFRQFGTRQMPYFKISKINTFTEILHLLKNIIRSA